MANQYTPAEKQQISPMQPALSSLDKAKKISQAKDTLKMLISNGKTVNPDNWNTMFGDVMPYSDMMVENEKINQRNVGITQDWNKKNPWWLPIAKPFTSILNPKPVMGAENTPQPQEQLVEDINMGFLENAKKTQGFGEKTFSFYGKGGHEGNDYRAQVGTPVRGFQGWIVDFAGQGESYYGNKVVLRNPKTGEAVEFAHLKDIGVQKGQTIGKDQIIATTGNSGYRPDGKPQQAHLHVNYYTPDDRKGDIAKVAKKAEGNFAMVPSFDSVINKAKGIVSEVKGTVIPQVQAQEEKPSVKKQPELLREEQNPNSPGAYYGKSIGSYTVKPGDSLSGLAAAYKTTVADFMRQNPQIKDPNRISANTTLNIPSAPTVETKNSGYTIRSGDTLNAIAKKLGTDVNTLVRKNQIQNPNLIRAGQVIKY